MKAWLTMILHNFFFDQCYEKKRWISVADGFAEEECWEQLPTDNPGPESHILLKELSGKISDVLSKIPDEFRLPIILVDMGNFSYEEATEILFCPTGTIRSRPRPGSTQCRARPGGPKRINSCSETRGDAALYSGCGNVTSNRAAAGT